MHQIRIKTETSSANAKTSGKASVPSGSGKKLKGDDFGTMINKAKAAEKSLSEGRIKRDAAAGKNKKTVISRKGIPAKEKGKVSLKKGKEPETVSVKGKSDSLNAGLRPADGGSGLKHGKNGRASGKEISGSHKNKGVRDSKLKTVQKDTRDRKTPAGKPAADMENTVFASSAVLPLSGRKGLESKKSTERTAVLKLASDKKDKTGNKKVSHASGEKVHKVIDLRKSAENPLKSPADGAGDLSPDTDSRDPGGTEQNNQIKTLTMTVRRGDEGSEFIPARNAREILSSELRDSLNDKIVKQSNIILKDKDAGEIRLILKPESLGKVRIRLHLEDNNLTGKIVVDNPHVKDVFEQNMFRLEKAFSDSGFSMGSMDVSVGEKGDDRAKHKNDQINGKVLKIIEDSVPGIGENMFSSNVIDLVV